MDGETNGSQKATQGAQGQEQQGQSQVGGSEANYDRQITERDEKTASLEAQVAKAAEQLRGFSTQQTHQVPELWTNDHLEQCLLARYDHLFGRAGSYDGTIADVGDVVGGATPSKKKPEYYCHDGIGWITPKDLSNTSDKFIAHGADDITQIGFESCSVKKLPTGTVLFSSRAPIGYMAIAADEVTTNQGFKSVVPRPEIGTAFVYCFLARNKDRIADAGSGTTFPEVSGKTMAGIQLALPDIELCAEFEE